MASVSFRGVTIHTVGDLPEVGSVAPDFTLVGRTLAPVTMAEFVGKTLILNIFPSIDTPVCATSVRRFYELAGALPEAAVLNVSGDLPFAQARFCAAQELEFVQSGSSYRSTFGRDYGVAMTDGPLEQLLTRAVVAVQGGRVVYTQLVPDLGEEPDYGRVLRSLGWATSRV